MPPCEAVFRIRLSAILLSVSLAVMGSSAHSQELEPRTYSNTPDGLNFAVAGYAYTTGDVVSDPSIPLENSSIQVHEAVFAYARGLDIFGKSGKFDVLLPYA